MIDLYAQGRFPFDKLISFYPFDAINQAVEDQRVGRAIKPVLEREGYFVQPTVVRDLANGARLVREEQFGPVPPMQRYSNTSATLCPGKRNVEKARRRHDDNFQN